MKYYCRLIIRIVLALLISVLSVDLIYFVFSKLTFYLTYLTLFFYKPEVYENVLVINNEILEFVPACTAGSAYVLLILLVLLTKDIGFKKSVYMVLLGCFLILVANLIRLELLIVIFISYSKNLFGTLHMFFWKVLSSVYVFLVWIFLIYKFKVREIPVYSDIAYLAEAFLSFSWKENLGKETRKKAFEKSLKRRK